jgi:GxxExxY protein
MPMKNYKHREITEKIIGAAQKVHNTQPIAVHYHGEIVGNYVADIVVDGKVILEIKAVKELSEIHEVQLVHYLKATGIEIGLLINFGRSVTVKRRVMDKK